MPITSCHDLEVYKRAKALMVAMHKLVETFPVHERFYRLIQNWRKL